MRLFLVFLSYLTFGFSEAGVKVPKLDFVPPSELFSRPFIALLKVPSVVFPVKSSFP